MIKKPIHNLCCISLLLVIIAFYNCAISKEAKQSLFNGKTFTNWNGNFDMFSIKDGVVIAGHLDKKIPRNEFLCTNKQYDDFELTLKVKALGEGVNAGIQFRTRRIPNHNEVIGYQADVGVDHNGPLWGFLYDESRRRKFLTDADQAAMQKVLKIEDWNEFVIRAEGNRIQIWLNGHQTVDYMETEKVATTGQICLQIHGGPPSEAWYKDIEIKEL